MFSFMKHKDKKEKEEKKKEKKEKKEKEKKDKREPMTQDELNKLDEVKKGVFRRLSDKDKSRKSGYKASGSQEVKRDTSDSSLSGGGPSPTHEASPEPPEQRVSLTKPQRLPSEGRADRKAPPSIAPKPKSILKGKVEQQHPVQTDIDDTAILQENTRMNEYNAHVAAKSRKDEAALAKQESKSQTSRSSTEFASPQKTPEKSYKSDLKLPEIVPPKPPRVRELVLHRQPTGGFGFTLRKAVIVDSAESGEEIKNTVVFAEPGSGPKASLTGLIPGDKLIEINGINVENVSREEMVEMIRQSGETVTVKVQPIQELIELSVRPGGDGGSVEVEETVSKGGTLKRSGSVRYKKGVGTSILSDRLALAWPSGYL